MTGLYCARDSLKYIIRVLLHVFTLYIYYALTIPLGLKTQAILLFKCLILYKLFLFYLFI